MQPIIAPPRLADTPVFGLPERFWDKINVTEQGCWEWNGTLHRKGYAQCKLGGRTRQTHRVAYTVLVGPIPDGLDIDHLCRVRRCVNPSHLEPVTAAENNRRAARAKGRNARARKTHCPQGHPYDEANVYTDPRGDRQCRTCRRERNREAAARRRAAQMGGVR